VYIWFYGWKNKILNDMLITTKFTHWIYFNIHVFGFPFVEIRQNRKILTTK